MEIPRAFVCAESKIFDVSEWAICQVRSSVWKLLNSVQFHLWFAYTSIDCIVQYLPGKDEVSWTNLVYSNNSRDFCSSSNCQWAAQVRRIPRMTPCQIVKVSLLNSWAHTSPAMMGAINGLRPWRVPGTAGINGSWAVGPPSYYLWLLLPKFMILLHDFMALAMIMWGACDNLMRWKFVTGNGL